MGKELGIVEYGEEKCPECECKKLNFGSYEPQDDSFRQTAQCRECQFEFELWADKPKFWVIYSR